MKKKIISLLLVMVLLMGGSLPAYAWKLSTHNYSANLLMEELKANSGKLEVYPYGKMAIPNEFYNAIMSYPDAFRAGCMGPDIYPEMITGQSNIHTIVNDTTSGDWFDLLVEEYQKMPASNEKAKVLAFILGYGVHYSGDLFGHTYVNEWAGGEFPELISALNSQTKFDNIKRHVILESYIDGKVPERYKSGAAIKLDAPLGFVQKTLIEKGHEKFGIAEFLDPIMDLRGKLKENSDDMKAFSGTLSPDNLLKYGVNTNIAGYSERWYEDIDKGMYEFIKANQETGQALLDKNAGVSDSIEPLTDWMGDYAPQMSPVPDAAIMAIGLKKEIVFEIAEYIGLDEIEEAWDQVKSGAFIYAFSTVFGIDLNELMAYFKNPETYINSDLFPAGRTTSEVVDKDLGNYSSFSSSKDIEFDPFYNTMQMSKLVLLGSDNLNKIFKNTTFEKTPMIGTFDVLNINIRTFNNSGAPWTDSGSNGTDDDIFFHLKLKNGKSYRFLMDKPGENDFESGNNRTYRMELPTSLSYGDVASVMVEKKNIVNDDWGPDYIRVYPDNGRDVLPKTKFDKYFRGNAKWSRNINLEDEYNGHSQLDPSIINFIEKLDGDHQWGLASFYKKDTRSFHEIFRNIEDVNMMDRTKLAYYNELDGSDTSEFDLYNGTWVGTGAGYNVKSSAGGGDKAILKNRNYEDFVAEVKVGVGDNYKRSNTPHQDSGIVFRVSNPGYGADELNGYYFGLNSIKDELVIGMFEGHKWKALKRIPYTINSYNDMNASKVSYVLRVDAQGDKFIFYVDGKVVHSMTNDRFTTGSVGMRQYSNVDGMFAFFDYLNVLPYDDGQLILRDTLPEAKVTTSTSNTSSNSSAKIKNEKSGGIEVLNTENIKMDKAVFALSFTYNGKRYYTMHHMKDMSIGRTAELIMHDRGEDNGTTIMGDYFEITEKEVGVPNFWVQNCLGDISEVSTVFGFTQNGKDYRMYNKFDTLSTDHMFKIEFQEGEAVLVPTY